MGRAWSIEIAFSLESLWNWARNPLLLIHGLGYSKVADSDIDSQSGHPPAGSLVFLMYSLSLSAKRFKAIEGAIRRLRGTNLKPSLQEKESIAGKLRWPWGRELGP